MADTKRCSTCHKVQSYTEFNRRATAPDGLQPRCRACCRRWYEEHRAVHIANVYRRKVAYRAVLLGQVRDYLTTHPCVDCGETDVRCLEFDHRDRATKSSTIAKMVCSSSPWSAILREIDKCDVRCANCHRKKTAAEDNSWRHQFFLAMIPPPTMGIVGGGTAELDDAG